MLELHDEPENVGYCDKKLAEVEASQLMLLIRPDATLLRNT